MNAAMMAHDDICQLDGRGLSAAQHQLYTQNANAERDLIFSIDVALQNPWTNSYANRRMSCHGFAPEQLVPTGATPAPPCALALLEVGGTEGAVCTIKVATPGSRRNLGGSSKLMTIPEVQDARGCAEPAAM